MLLIIANKLCIFWLGIVLRVLYVTAYTILNNILVSNLGLFSDMKDLSLYPLG